MLYFTACTENKNKDIKNNIQEIKEENITASSHALAPEWGISDIVGIKDGNLICKARNAENFFYILDPTSFILKGSFGVKGNAANEWIMPHLLLPEEKGECYVIDNGTRKMHILKDYKITSKKDAPVNGLVNDAKMFAGFVCYQDISPDRIILRINDISKGVTNDSIVFEDPTHQGMSDKDDFAYDVRNGHLVLGKRKKDDIQIFNISDNGKLDLQHEISGNTKDEKNYYTAVAIGNDIVYLLSQRNRDKKYSNIEVYNFDGKAIKNIKLGFEASKMAYNPDGNTLILLDRNGGTLKTIKL